MKWLREFIYFGFAGAIGFLVDTAVLYLLKGMLGVLYARPFSFLAAVLATWLINRNITFKHRRSGLPLHREFTHYLVLMLAGGGINLGIYAWLVIYFESVRLHPYIGVAMGSLAGMTVNLAASRLLLFRSGPTVPPESR